MHKNDRFNIMQAPGANNRNFVVIDGKRLPSGLAAEGAKIVSAEMPRDEAIKVADMMEAALCVPGSKQEGIMRKVITIRPDTIHADQFATWLQSQGHDAAVDGGWQHSRIDGVACCPNSHALREIQALYLEFTNAVYPATHEVVEGVFNDVIKTGTYEQCMSHIAMSDKEHLVMRTIGETERRRNTAPIMANPRMLAASAAQTGAEYRAAGLPIDDNPYAALDEREAFCMGWHGATVAEQTVIIDDSEFLYQYEADDGIWEDCDERTYSEYKEDGAISVRRFVLVEE